MATVHKMRREHGLPTVDMSLHMVFTGNPGTGKTMIARLMARIYRSLGILSKGQLVETDRSGLVAGFVGQTAQKTAEVIEKAKGGVLFIDEAYALNGSGQNDFGQEAIDTLLKAMEDHREDLVVIVAGYDQLMENFIRSNPGLESRFNRYLHFDDYSVDEMCQLLEMQLKKHQYTLDEEGKRAARDYIEASNTHTISFGNARGVRNIFERLLVQQANRLAGQQGDWLVEDSMTITAADVQKTRETDDKLNDALKKEQEIIDKRPGSSLTNCRPVCRDPPKNRDGAGQRALFVQNRPETLRLRIRKHRLGGRGFEPGAYYACSGTSSGRL